MTRCHFIKESDGRSTPERSATWSQQRRRPPSVRVHPEHCACKYPRRARQGTSFVETRFTMRHDMHRSPSLRPPDRLPDFEPWTRLVLRRRKALGRSVDLNHWGSRGNYRMLETPPDEPVVQIQRVDHESRVHLDIETDDITAEVARLEKLGAHVVDRLERWVVMQAPTGQRFCVVRVQRPGFPKECTKPVGLIASCPLHHLHRRTIRWLTARLPQRTQNWRERCTSPRQPASKVSPNSCGHCRT